MKRFALLAVLAIAILATLPPAASPATPAAYDLTCTIFGTPSPDLAFYPVPGAGGPDATDLTGVKGVYNGFNSCGWGSRPYRAGEQTKLCGTPAIMSGVRPFTTQNFKVYNDGVSCMVVTAISPATPQTYADVSVVCHTPLTAGSAPAASFYSEVGGALSPGYGGFGALPSGTCAGNGGVLAEAAFCVALNQDAPYKNQLQDLTYTGFYQMTVHTNPGCNIYERGTLKYLGATYPATPFATPTRRS